MKAGIVLCGFLGVEGYGTGDFPYADIPQGPRPGIQHSDINLPNFEVLNAPASALSSSESFAADNEHFATPSPLIDGMIQRINANLLLECVKCQSHSWAGCLAHQQTEVCRPDSTCHVEIRKRNGKINYVKMGCKQTHGCKQQKRQNFNWRNPAWSQCRPNAQRGPSVCRQCCSIDRCALDLNNNDRKSWRDNLILE